MLKSRVLNTTATLHTTPGESISIRGLARVFPDGSGLHPTSIEVAAGEFLSVLGPSGCGKSTLLRCVAGLETPDAGAITFGESVMFDGERRVAVAPRSRGLGMVFQDLALWPHLSTAENVAFPLQVAKTPKDEVAQRVREALDLVGLSEFMEKMPHQLSGGQQQRVAIARAIVARPRVLLMDEPFSALDAALRLQLRAELRDLTSRLGLTTVYVTHDQAEAMSMSDRIAVLERGVLRQVSTPEELYERPANQFVAEFIGQCNWLPGHEGVQGVRPERVRVMTHSSDAASIPATIESCVYTGGRYTLTARVYEASSTNEPVTASQLWSLEHDSRITPGTEVSLSMRESDVMHVG